MLPNSLPVSASHSDHPAGLASDSPVSAIQFEFMQLFKILRGEKETDMICRTTLVVGDGLDRSRVANQDDITSSQVHIIDVHNA